MSIIYKVFETPKGNYIYDRNRHRIIVLSKEDYDAFQGTDEAKLQVVKKLQKKKFLMESTMKVIRHPMDNYLDDFTKFHMEELILQVTQKCNLRCSYCFYGENNYTTRTHTDLDMPIEIAKRAIDFFLQHSSTTEKTVIAFYGGEPMINIELIKMCIKYVEENYGERNVAYIMTTNGTLLTEKNIRYLAQKEFSLIISMDGTQKTHDANRRFVNGKGTYDIICKNLLHMRAIEPELYNKILFNTVISPEMNVKDVEKYYANDEIMKVHSVLTSTITPHYLEKPVSYNDKFYVESKYGDFKIFLYKLGRIELEDIPAMYRNRINRLDKEIKFLHSDFALPQTSHHGGPCVPSAKRLFVNINGDLYPCERVSESSKIMKIGTVYDGLYMPEVRRLLNVGRISEDRCLKCWSFNNCSICGAAIDNLQDLDDDMKIKECKSMQNSTLQLFKDICMLKELGGKI